MNVVTWNVNSLRAHLDRVLAWLERHRPDVLCLQETKCTDAELPRADFERLGYHVAAASQPARNGVATLTRAPMTDVLGVLPGEETDDHARFVSGRLGETTVVNVYVPNGQGVATDAFFYKLAWLARLLSWLKTTQDAGKPLVLVGDFNICPADLDVYWPEAYRGRLHCTDHERKAIDHLRAWGLTDTLRHLHPDTPGLYTWFDYTPKAFRKREGLRIDLILATKPLIERLTKVEIDCEERAPKKTGSKPSDHCPLIASFRD